MSIASEKLQYTLTLSTVSTGTGARDTARDLERVSAAAAAAGDKAKVSQWGYYNLDEQLKSTSKHADPLATGIERVGRSSSNAGMGVLMLSQGFEDAQYGMRAVLNNIPPMLMAFGMSAGVAGVVSVAAVSFSVLYNWLGKTEEKASDVTERMQALGSKLENFHSGSLDRIRNELEDDLELSNALDQKWKESSKSQNDYAASALDNMAKLREIQRGIVELLGDQVLKQNEIIAIADAEEQKRRMMHEQALAAEQQRLESAREEVQKERAPRDVQAQDRANTIEVLNSARERLGVLKEERAELEKIASQRITWSQALAEGGSIPGMPTAPAKEAQKQLEEPIFNLQLDTIGKQVEDLSNKLEQLQGPGGTIAKQEIAIAKAETQAADIEESVKINTQKLEETFRVDELNAQLNTATDLAKQQASDIKLAVSQVTSTTEEGEAAKQTLIKAASDGLVTAKESSAVADMTRKMMAEIQVGLATTSGNQQEVLNLLQNISQQAARDRNEITVLKRQQEVLFRRANQ